MPCGSLSMSWSRGRGYRTMGLMEHRHPVSKAPERSGLHEWGTMMDRPYLSRATRPVVGPAPYH